jgi:hypothetical protein
VHALWGIDFKSWFVQLEVDSHVRDTFFCVLFGAKWKRMTGMPMGFSWAPVVAQAITSVITREACKRFVPRRVVYASAYIDNVAVALSSAEDAEEWHRTFMTVANETGAVVKPSSIEQGISIEWRGLALDLLTRTATLKLPFVHRLSSATALLKTAPLSTVPRQVPFKTAVSALAFVIYATMARMRPLGIIHNSMKWLAKLSSLSFVTQPAVSAPRQVLLELDQVVADAANPITLAEFSYPYRPAHMIGRVLPHSCGVSDAAGGSGAFRAWATHTTKGMTLRVEAAPPTIHIGCHEFRALAGGYLAGCASVGPSVWSWQGDNMGANHQASFFSWNQDPTENELMQRVFVCRMSSPLSVSYCPTRYMLMDIFTRHGQPLFCVAPPCPSHPGRFCQEFADFLWKHAPQTAKQEWKDTSRPSFSFRHPTYALRHEARVFHDGQPSEALADKWYNGRPHIY